MCLIEVVCFVIMLFLLINKIGFVLLCVLGLSISICDFCCVFDLEVLCLMWLILLKIVVVFFFIILWDKIVLLEVLL